MATEPIKWLLESDEPWTRYRTLVDLLNRSEDDAGVQAARAEMVAHPQIQALIADAIHSLSDVVVSVLLIISLKVSSTPPDEDHPWGHGNVEFIVSAIFGVLLVCAAVAITAVSITSIVQGNG